MTPMIQSFSRTFIKQPKHQRLQSYTTKRSVPQKYLNSTIILFISFAFFKKKHVCVLYMYACSIVCGGAFMCVHAYVPSHVHSSLLSLSTLFMEADCLAPRSSVSAFLALELLIGCFS